MKITKREDIKDLFNFTGICLYPNGDKEWYKNGKIHREDGPAVEWSDGSKVWYKNGLKHREDGPACEWCNGSKYWYRNGLVHREDGPAIENSDGSKYWYRNGKEYTKQEYYKELFKNGKITEEELFLALL